MSPDNNIINPDLFKELEKSAPDFAKSLTPITEEESYIMQALNRHDRRAKLAELRKKK